MLQISQKRIKMANHVDQCPLTFGDRVTIIGEQTHHPMTLNHSKFSAIRQSFLLPRLLRSILCSSKIKSYAL
jgi:hypothetical protein